MIVKKCLIIIKLYIFTKTTHKIKVKIIKKVINFKIFVIFI